MKKLVLSGFLLAACFVGIAQPAPSNPAKDWTISLQLWTFRVFNFHDAVAKADSCGIRYIQAFPGQKLGGKWSNSFGPDMTAKEREEVNNM